MKSRNSLSLRNQRLANVAFDLLEPCAPRILQVTAPIFREPTPGTLESIGSAVLVRMGDEPLVLSAAHVLDDATTETPLYVGTHNSVLLLEGRWFRTPLPKSGFRVDDHVDVGIARLPSSALASFDDRSFLSINELAPRQTLAQGAYAVISGYPSKKEWAGFLEREANLYMVIAECSAAEDYSRLEVDRSHAVVLGFDQKRCRTRQGATTAPKLKGVSGGGLWVLRRPEPEPAPVPQLAGILIEWHAGARKRIVATRIEVLLSGIWGYWPELRPFLP